MTGLPACRASAVRYYKTYVRFGRRRCGIRRTYLRYGDERSRPFHDLVARVPADRPRAVVDLGCGPGTLTATLAERWPAARVARPGLLAGDDRHGPRALGRARSSFAVGDVRDWRPGPTSTWWSPTPCCSGCPGTRSCCAAGPAELPAGALARRPGAGQLRRPVAPGAARGRRPGRAGGTGSPRCCARHPVDDPVDYAALLAGAGCAVDAWETTYVHLLPAVAADHPVLAWMEGTALRPVRAALATTPAGPTSAPSWANGSPRRTRCGRAGVLPVPPRLRGRPAPADRARPAGGRRPPGGDRPVRLHRRTAQGGAARAPRRLRLAADRGRAGRPARGAHPGAGRSGRARRLLRVPRLRPLHRGLPERRRPDPGHRGRLAAHPRGGPGAGPPAGPVRRADRDAVLARAPGHPGAGVLRGDRGRPASGPRPTSASRCAGASTSPARPGCRPPRRRCGSPWTSARTG